MPKHEKKQCPRCAAEFECKTGSVLLCQCSKIEMTEAQLEYSNSQYDDCLCLSCLQSLKREYNNLSHHESIKSFFRKKKR